MSGGFPQFEGTLHGRDDSIGALREAVRSGGVATVVGPGGMGKTRLVTEFAANFEGEARFVGLVNATAPQEIERTVGRALGLIDDPTADHLLDAVDDVDLIVFDNVEQVIEPFAEFLARRPGHDFAIVVTSREPLRIRGEQVVRLEGLDASSARALFRERHAAAGVDDVGGEVDELVATLDGLPLALEIAAARMTAMSAADFLARFRDGLDVAQLRRRDVARRHGTLRAAIEWSWDLLSDAPKRALQQAALFAAPFELEAAEAMLRIGEASVPDTLADLVDRSLLRFEPGSGQYSTLVAVRLFARSTMEPDVRREHLERLGRYLADQGGVDDVENMEAVLRELESDGVDTELRVALSEQLASALVRRGEPQAAIALLEGLGDVDAPADLLARRFVTQTHAYQHSHRHEDAVAVGRRAVEYADLAGDIGLGARARINLAGSLARVESFDTALETLDAARELAEKAGNEHVMTAVIGNRGMVSLSAGRLAESRADFETVLERSRALGNASHEALTLFHLAIVARDEGAAIDELLGLTDRAVRLARKAKNWRTLDMVERFQSYMLADEGRVDDALSLLGDVLARVRERAESTNEASVAFDVARTHPELDVRIERAEEVLTLARERALRGEVLTFLAGQYLVAGRTGFARARISEAVALVGDQVPARALLESYRALSHALDDDHDLARQAWDVAIDQIARRPDLESHVPLFEAALEALRRDDALDAAEWAELDERLGAFHRLHMRYGYANPVPVVLGLFDAGDRGHSPDVEVGPGGEWVRIEGGEPLDFSRRTTLRRLILFLARRAIDGPEPAPVEELLEAGWPDETMTYESGLNRVYSAVRTLRKLGLDDRLETLEEGYRLDPDLRVRVADDD